MNEAVLALTKNEYILTELSNGAWDIRYVCSKFEQAIAIFDEATKDATDIEKAIALSAWTRPAFRHIRELNDKPQFSVENLKAFAQQALAAAKTFTSAITDETEDEVALAQASFVLRIRDCFGLELAMQERARQALGFAKAVSVAFDPESAETAPVIEAEEVVGLPVEEVEGIPAKLVPYLVEAGFKTAESIVAADDNALRTVKNVSEKLPPLIRAAAQKAIDAHALAELDKALNADPVVQVPEVKTEEVKTDKVESPKVEKKTKGKKKVEPEVKTEPVVETPPVVTEQTEVKTEEVPEVKTEEVKTEGTAS